MSHAQVAVIAHESVPVEEIEHGDLLDIYTGDVRSWDDGEPVIVFDLKPRGDVKDIFYDFLGKSASRMKSIWLKRMLAGEGDPPPAIESEEAVLQKIKTTPGAVGFISQEKVTDEVKVLAVIKEE
jgi:ABC-type phosphate transport system substrate-binding protein